MSKIGVPVAICIGIAAIAPAFADNQPAFHLPPKPADDPWPDVAPMAAAKIATANADPRVQRGYQLLVRTQGNWAGNEGGINLQFAADHGNPVAQAASCGVDLANSRGEGQMTWALRRCRPAAEAGFAAAQLMVGLLLQVAGVEYDPRKSAHWLRQAALQGDPLAVVALGELYLSGKGVPADETVGLGLLQQAVDQAAHDGAASIRDGVRDYALYLRDDRPGGDVATRQAGRAALDKAIADELWLAQLRLSWLSRTGAPGVPQEVKAAHLYGDEALTNLIRALITPVPASVSLQQ